jgi:hypothetical protein
MVGTNPTHYMHITQDYRIYSKINAIIDLNPNQEYIKRFGRTENRDSSLDWLKTSIVYTLTYVIVADGTNMYLYVL